MSAPHRCSGVLEVRAECRTCGWISYARNAMGNAARHSSASGHEVHVEQTISVGFNCTADHPRRRP